MISLGARPDGAHDEVSGPVQLLFITEERRRTLLLAGEPREFMEHLTVFNVLS